VTSVLDVDAYGVLLQPSPMTASAAPLIPMLRGPALKIAIIYDFIPLHFPDVYLGNVAARAEYAAALDALSCYDEFLCISHVVAGELPRHVSAPAHAITVAWPAGLLRAPGEASPPPDGRVGGPIVVMTGDDPRKNTFGGLAGVGAATADDPGRDVVVLGMVGQGERVHHWSIAAMMRPGEARTTGRLTDRELAALLRRASVVVVPSFDEGLSLPVVEALAAGAPVVASDIPSHRELIGAGRHLADPRSPRSLARAVARIRGRSDVANAQWAHLSRHRHRSLEQAVGERLRQALAGVRTTLEPSAVHVSGRDPRIAVAGPWVPQPSGVADFTTTTTLELARIADVTVFTTSGADVAASIPDGVRLDHHRLADLDRHLDRVDVLVAVIGNSHFHLPFLDLIRDRDAVVIAHDTRMVELALALRSVGGLADLMLRRDPSGILTPPVLDQIDDLRLLQDLGMWEVARRARRLIVHTPTAADRIAAETGVPVSVLPFAHYRLPGPGDVTEAQRRDARRRLAMADGTLHLGSFGYIDMRSKMADVVLEAAGWLRAWGHRVHLHLVGSAPGPIDQALRERAAASDVALTITGFADEATYRDYLLAVDLGIQLRISPVLGVSGPLSDLAAFGTPAIASRGLADDIGAPSSVTRLPDAVSPVIVAEAVEARLARGSGAVGEAEDERREYLDRHSPARYAAELLALLR